jgi:putative (di)nucleoside polyphosphate hydrolase
VDFWYPAHHVVAFKRRVYERALRQFAPLVEANCQVRIEAWVEAAMAGAGG